MTITTRFIVGVGALALVAACAGDKKGSAGSTTAAASTTSGVDLNGAGATFPQPIYSKWFSDYAAKTGVKINYQSIGSGGGIRQLSEMTVDKRPRVSSERKVRALSSVTPTEPS